MRRRLTAFILSILMICSCVAPTATLADSPAGTGDYKAPVILGGSNDTGYTFLSVTHDAGVSVDGIYVILAQQGTPIKVRYGNASIYNPAASFANDFTDYDSSKPIYVCVSKSNPDQTTLENLIQNCDLDIVGDQLISNKPSVFDLIQDGQSFDESGNKVYIDFDASTHTIKVHIGKRQTVNVNITYTGTKGLTLANGAYYLVVGKETDTPPIAYQKVDLTNENAVQNRTFQFNALPSDGDMYVLLKHYDSATDNWGAQDSNYIVWNGHTSGEFTDGENTYTATWSGPVQGNNGELNYTISIADKTEPDTQPTGKQITVNIQFRDHEEKPIAPGTISGNTKVLVSIEKDDNHWIASKDITFNGTESDYQIVFDDSDTVYHADNSNPRDNTYANADSFEVYFGILEVNNSTGLPQEENGKIKGTLIQNGSSLGKFKFTKTVVGDTVTYVGTEQPGYKIRVDFQDKGYKPVLPKGVTGYYVYATLNDEGTYYFEQALNTDDSNTSYDFDASVFTKQYEAVQRNVTSNEPVSVGMISGASSSGVPSGSILKVGDAVGQYIIASIRQDTTTDPNNPVTVITLRETEPYHYSVSVLNVEGQEVTADIPAGKWVLVSRLTKQNKKVYYGCKTINEINTTKGNSPLEGDIEFTFAENEWGGIDQASAVYSGGDTVQTVLVHPNNASAEAVDCINIAFNNASYNGKVYKNGDGVGFYNMSSMDSSGNAIIKLTMTSQPKVTVNFLDDEGNPKSDLLTRTDGKYYVFVRMTDVSDYGYLTGPLDTTKTSDTVWIGDFHHKYNANDKLYLTGEHQYEAYLVFSQKDNFQDSGLAACFSWFGNDGGYDCTLYRAGEIVEGATVDYSEAYGHKTKTDATIDVQEIAPLKVNSTVVPPDSSITDSYYLLLEMKSGNTTSYQLVPLDITTAAKTDYDPIHYLTDENGSGKYYYTGKETLNRYIVTSSSGSLSLYDAVNGNNCHRFASGTMTSDLYQASISTPDEDNVIDVDLTKVTFGPGEDHDVEVVFYSGDAETLQATVDPALNAGDNYYILATLTPKGTGSKGQVVAYQIKGITLADQTLKNNEYHLKEKIEGENVSGEGFTMIDAAGEELTGIVPYDSSQFDLNVRIYHRDSGIPTSYNDAKGGDDLIPGFDFMSNKQSDDGKKHVVKLHTQHQKTYKVEVKFAPEGQGSPAITAEDKLYIYVQLDHKSGGNSEYYLAPLTATEGTASIDFAIANSDWKQANGDPVEGGYAFTGNETATVRIIKADGDSLSIDQARNKSNCNWIGEGEMIKASYTSYSAIPRDSKVTKNGETYSTEITDFVQLTRIEATNDYHYASILGDGLYYGITANEFHQRNHIQSNFAVNTYDGENNVVEADLAANSGTIVYGTSTNGKINIGASHSGEVLLYAGDGKNTTTDPLVNPRDFVFTIHEESQTLMDQFVNPILAHGAAMSNELLQHPATFTPAQNDSNAAFLEIDTMDFPDDATIYIDGDNITSWLGKGGGLRLTKKPNQMIVFNFDTSTHVSLNEFYCRYDRNDPWGPDNKSDTPVSKNDSHNKFIDGVAQHIVWNLNSATTVDIGISTGIFLAPQASVTVTSTSSGWIIADSFTNTGGEWHSVYGEMPSITKANFAVRKTVDNGTPKGTQKFMFKLERMKEDGTSYTWSLTDTPSEKHNDNGAVTFNEIDDMEIGWNIYRITETRLADGTPNDYTLSTRKIYALVYVDQMTSHGNTQIVAQKPIYFEEDESGTILFKEDAFTKDAASWEDAFGSPAGDGIIHLKQTSDPKFENKTKQAGLSIEKSVQGVNAPDALFTFKIELWQTVVIDSTNCTQYGLTAEDAGVVITVPTTGEIPVTGAREAASLNFTEDPNTHHGVAEIQLHQNETAQLSGLDVHTLYCVTETATQRGADATVVFFDGENKSNGYTNATRTASGEITEGTPSSTSFVNQYAAEETINFKAKKIFTGGDLSGKTFTFKMTQVKSSTDLTQADTNVKLSAPVTASTTTTAGGEKVTMLTAPGIKFTQEDDGKTFYFLIEEDLPVGATSANNYVDGGIRYDSSQKVIQVTVKDNKDGTLTITKNPSPAQGTDFDVSFENEQLGSVTVTKAFSGVDNLPDDFQIEAVYEVNGATVTKTLKTGQESDITPTYNAANHIYTWTIPDLPLGTNVTFEESGLTVNGYDVAVTINSTAVSQGQELKGTTQAAVTPGSVSFVNTYTRKTGDLEISKKVTGTSDKSQVFPFTITVKDGDNDLNGTYSVETNATGNESSQFGSSTDQKITFNNGTANITLKADEYVKIKGLPEGVVYTVTEDTTSSSMPDGYEKVSPATSASGTISSTSTSKAEFINNYTNQTVSVSFGGKKFIEGTTSTNRQFTFKLYQTDATFNIAGKNPIDTAQTTAGEYSAEGQTYSFGAITYGNSHYDATTDHKYYYVIVEEQLVKTDTGWTTSTVEYHETVTLSKDTNGILGCSVTSKKKDTSTSQETDGPSHTALDFTNTYEASGKVSFQAKKIFTNGLLSDHPIKIRLSQVSGDGKKTAPTEKIVLTNPITVDLDTGANGQAGFTDAVTFLKNKGTNGTPVDQTGEYWFMLEELDQNGNEVQGTVNGVKYDATPRVWIKVKVTDQGDGTLKVEKTPNNTPDVTFTNEQLGKLILKKTVVNNNGATVPQTYIFNVQGADQKFYGENGIVSNTAIPITVTGGDTGVTLSDLPIQAYTVTEVTGTNNADIKVEGYTVTVSADPTVTATKDGSNATATITNTYTRDNGKLKLKKTVTVNGQGTNTKLVDGTYSFTIQGIGTLNSSVTKPVTITIKDGKFDSATGTDGNTPDGEGWLVISGLPTGQYTVTENLTSDQTARGISIAEKPETALTVVKDEAGAVIPTAAFRNNLDIGDLEIGKTVAGTTNRTQDFEFEVTLTAPAGVKLKTTADAYAAVRTDVATSGSAQQPTTNGTVTLTQQGTTNDYKVTGISFNSGNKILLKATEKLKIVGLPAGTTYTVTEKTLPDGYQKTSPAGDATGTIVADGCAEANFVNTYSLGTTSVLFGGRKLIEGTEATDQKFEFELYSTGSDYDTTASGASLLQTAEVTGPISSNGGKGYQFTAITYDQNSGVPSNGSKAFYYVVKEKALNPANGWTNSNAEYHIQVDVSDDTHGGLTTQTTCKLVNGSTETDASAQTLNFTNTYEASGKVSFQAKKIFTNGLLSDHPIKIRLSQVSGDGKKTAPTEKIVLTNPITVDLDTGANGQAGFTDAVTFLKNKGTNGTPVDQTGEYWFMLEELDQNGNEVQGTVNGVKYDATPRVWIKVKVTDQGDGTLKVEKTPNNTLDVTFTNEQLGGVKVKKVFDGHTVPEGFKIEAKYTIGTETITTDLVVDSNTVGDGTQSSPYEWEIKDLPIGTTVSFEEKGITVDGYSIETTFNGTVTADATGTLSAAKTAPEGKFVNTYKRDRGGLQVAKTVNVNGTAPATTDTALVDDTYSFRIQSASGVVPATNRTFTIKIQNGVATEAVFDSAAANTDVSATISIDTTTHIVTIQDLPTGDYTVTEELTSDQTQKGIHLTAQPTTAFTVSKYVAGTTTLDTAAFTNDRDIGDLEISKKVEGTPPDQSALFTFEVTLIAPDGVTLDTNANAYVADRTNQAASGSSQTTTTGTVTLTKKEGTTNRYTITSVTFNNGSSNSVQLKATEKLLIKGLPAGTQYIVSEKDIPAGYSQTLPSGNCTGDIPTGGTVSAEFTNTYSTNKVSITFGGTKVISGTDSTTKVFTFELYETDSTFNINASGAGRVESKSTTGTITGSQDYSFTPIEYTGQGTHYYVIRELALNPTDGWSISAVTYQETVVVTDVGGQLQYTASPKAANALNFTNNYTASGNVTFKAKKVLTGSTLNQTSFVIKLTQVDGDQSTTPASTNVVLSNPITKIVNTGTEQVAVFGEGTTEKINFVKKPGKDDTTDSTTHQPIEYWFMLEEVVPANLPSDHIDPNTHMRYDATPRVWIKVTAEDQNDGTLKITKSTSSITHGTDTDLDVVFTNEQLGGVRVKKVFDGHTAPEGFKITATYTVNGTQCKDELTTSSTGVSGTGTAADPYIWEIKDLPVDTVVTFTESGYVVGGYSETTTFTSKVNGTDTTATSDTGTLTAAKNYPEGTFVNTYERDRGGLQVTKTVNVNGTAPAATDTALVDDTYSFRIQSASGVVPATNRTFTIKIQNGVATEAAFDSAAANTDTGATISIDTSTHIVTIQDLPTGDYTVTEELTSDQTQKGIHLTAQPTTAFTVSKYVAGTTRLDTAAFTNDRDIGDLEITKTVSRTPDKTQDFTFEVTLTAPAGVTIDGTYTAVKTDKDGNPSDTSVTVSSGKVTPNITLKADEKILIRNLPGGTSYTVREINLPAGYELVGSDGSSDTLGGDKKTAAFRNQFKEGTTSVTFGGTKFIEGTNSTSQVFTFELYEADASFHITGTPTKTYTTGTITGKQTYSFGPITYSQTDNTKTFYYVIKETQLDQSATGWICSTVEYHETVAVAFDNTGLKATVTSVKVEGNNQTTMTAANAESSLDFTNTYEASGTLTFKAKKTFTNGELSGQFMIRLRQVDAQNSTTQKTGNGTILTTDKTIQPVDANPLAFDSITFTKKKDGNTIIDQTGEYWFMIEEVLPGGVSAGQIKDGVRYDTTCRYWIKVKVTDQGDGTLLVEKTPNNAIDASFTNEQLGKLTLKKTVVKPDGATTIPTIFTFNVQGADQKFYGENGLVSDAAIPITVTEGNTGVTLSDLPIQDYTVTEVTGTDNAGIKVTGYTVVVTDNNQTVAATKDGNTATITNTYTRDNGKLKLKKTVTVNGQGTNTKLVDGTYTFTIQGIGTLNSSVTKTVTITIENGVFKSAETGGQSLTPDNNGWLEIDNLPTGQYTVTENLTSDQTARGISIAEKPDTALTVVKDENGAVIPTAAFQNNLDIGDLTISKTVKRTTNRTAVFNFTVTLKKGGTPISGTYPATFDLITGTKEESVTFNSAGTYTFPLHADEKVTIHNLPAGTSYTVTEADDSRVYTITKPSGGTDVGTIQAGGTGEKASQAAFENTYNLKNTSLTFAAVKTIQGTNSTHETFTFELYETGAGYKVEDGQKPLSTASTKGTEITSGTRASNVYTFDTITYEVGAKGGNGVFTTETHYYVVKETAINNVNGWTSTDVQYRARVIVKDDSQGTLTKEITITDKNGTPVDSSTITETSLPFTNEYEATGTVSFTAKKTFTKGKLKDHNFQIRLTQVTGKNSTTAVDGFSPIVIPVNEDGSVQTVEFTNVKTFTKNKDHDDTTDANGKPIEYWFLIEEVLPEGTAAGGVKDSVQYDVNNQRWIKVTLSDDGQGTLKVTKDGSVSGDLDASFTNELLMGNLRITKDLVGTDWGNLTDAQRQNILFTVTGPQNYKKTFTLADMDANHQYTLSDLMLGDYTVTETKAEWNVPKGFAFQSVTYSVQGGTTTVKKDETAEVTVTNTYTCSVQVQKTDVVTGKELPGAKIEIRDENGTVIDSWTSTTTPHVVTGLEVGKTYTLHEEVAPKGYTLTTDTCFTIDATGKVTGVTENPTPIRDDGVLLVEDSAEDTPLAVRKVWDDQNNRDGIRPVSITVSLQADGETVRTVTLSESNNWFAVEKNLPKMKDGKEITYTWKEGNVSGYTLSGTSVKGFLTTLTNTRTPDKTRVEVTKKWNDGGAQDRPNEIKVQLFADGVAYGTPLTLSEANGWHAAWTDIPAHTNPTGTAGGQRNIVYTVEEVNVPEGYTCRISGSQAAGYVITNTRNAGRLVIRKQFDVQEPEANPPEDIVWINLPVTKTWVDNDNADGNRPASITVHLWKGGKVIQTAELSAATGWAWTFGPLPKYNGENKPENEIAYSITEEPVPLYSSKVDGFHITNTLQDERTSVSVRKIWDDNNNEAGKRPQNIRMTLSNGMSVILNEENGWSATINDLPVRVGGKVVQYVWREQEVIGYVQSGREVNGSVTTFTNKLWTRGEIPEDAGTPRIPGDTWYIFEEYDTPLGVEVIINHVGDCFD